MGSQGYFGNRKHRGYFQRAEEMGLCGPTHGGFLEEKRLLYYRVSVLYVYRSNLCYAMLCGIDKSVTSKSQVLLFIPLKKEKKNRRKEEKPSIVQRCISNLPTKAKNSSTRHYPQLPPSQPHHHHSRELYSPNRPTCS